MYKDDVFTVPHLSQFSAYHQHLYKHNHLHPSLELWKTEEPSITETDAGTISPENTGEPYKLVWGCSHLPKEHHRRLDSEAELCFSLQRDKLIPRVLIPTVELLKTWLAQQSHLKINDECFKKLSILMTYFSYQQLGKSTLWMTVQTC